MRRITCLVVLLAAAALGGGCKTVSDVMDTTKIDYKSSGKLPPLEIPPDLTRPSADDRFAVPDIGTAGTATYSTYNKERSVKPEAGTSMVLPNVDSVRIERAGTQRWLVVKGTPEQLWSPVKEFWQEIGFIINIETPETGVMETDWAENRAKIPDDGVRGLFGKVLDMAYSTAERDKFRTRLERGTAADTTEIYISHRGMVEVYASEYNDRTTWQPRPPDPDVEADMLRRLMVRLGVQESKASAAVAAAGAQQPRARILKTPDGAGKLAMNDEFDRAWRRVGLALDRVGFTVEDRDRSKGMYFVRYVDPDADNQKQSTGILSKLAFWRGNKPAPKEQYRILVKGDDAGAEVNVLDQTGTVDKSDTANRILTLLYEQLK